MNILEKPHFHVSEVFYASGVGTMSSSQAKYTDTMLTGSSWELAASKRHRATYVVSAYRILACREQAEDVVQDVMLRLATDLRPPDEGSSVAYVGRMVRNLAIDRARRRALERRLFTGLDSVPDTVDPRAGTPEATVVSRETLRQVNAAVAELPERVRTAFRLHRVEGLQQTEIAQKLGISRALVCGFVRRGHLHCLAALDRRCPTCPALSGASEEPRQHQRQAEAVREEFSCDPAGEHAGVAEQRWQDQQRRDECQPLRGQRHGGGAARRANRLEQGRGGQL